MSAVEEVLEPEVLDEPGTEMVRRDVALSVTPQVGAQELVARLATIREAMETAMTRDVDYGVIPGTGTKPTLLKPGAEKLSALFQLDVQLVNEKLWDAPHLTVVSKATVFHAPSGARLGYGEGICSTREKKYAKRRAEFVCPSCGKANIRRSKNGDGFYCWVKTDGCGQNFKADDARITGQQAGEVENPDLPDTWNTVVKMAEKRARVDAVLAVTGASALFTQDVEDMAEAASEPAPAAAQEPPSVEVELVTAEDIKALERAAKGLKIGQLKLAMTAIGAPSPEPFSFAGVPKSRAAALFDALGGFKRHTT